MQSAPRTVTTLAARHAPPAALMPLLLLATLLVGSLLVALVALVAGMEPAVGSQSPAGPLLGPFRWQPMAAGLA